MTTLWIFLRDTKSTGSFLWLHAFFERRSTFILTCSSFVFIGDKPLDIGTPEGVVTNIAFEDYVKAV